MRDALEALQLERFKHLFFEAAHLHREGVVGKALVEGAVNAKHVGLLNCSVRTDGFCAHLRNRHGSQVDIASVDELAVGFPGCPDEKGSGSGSKVGHAVSLDDTQGLDCELGNAARGYSLEPHELGGEVLLQLDVKNDFRKFLGVVREDSVDLPHSIS